MSSDVFAPVPGFFVSSRRLARAKFAGHAPTDRSEMQIGQSSSTLRGSRLAHAFVTFQCRRVADGGTVCREGASGRAET